MVPLIPPVTRAEAEREGGKKHTAGVVTLPELY